MEIAFYHWRKQKQKTTFDKSACFRFQTVKGGTTYCDKRQKQTIYDSGSTVASVVGRKVSI